MVLSLSVKRALEWNTLEIFSSGHNYFPDLSPRLSHEDRTKGDMLVCRVTLLKRKCPYTHQDQSTQAYSCLSEVKSWELLSAKWAVFYFSPIPTPSQKQLSRAEQWTQTMCFKHHGALSSGFIPVFVLNTETWKMKNFVIKTSRFSDKLWEHLPNTHKQDWRTGAVSVTCRFRWNFEQICP